MQRDFDEGAATLEDQLSIIYRTEEKEDGDADVDSPNKLTTVEKVCVALKDIDDYSKKILALDFMKKARAKYRIKKIFFNIKALFGLL